MASVVRRPNGWEVRESVSTPRGPRSRTLASFKRLDEAAIDHAIARASKPLERAELVKAALRAGAPVEAASEDAHAEALIRALERGNAPRPALRRLLAGILDQEPPASPQARAVAGWVASSPAERGAALEDLLLLADAIPVARRPGELAFPGFRPS